MSSILPITLPFPQDKKLDSPDPVVWQGANGDHIEWFSEEYSVSQFLMAMWKWVVTGEMEQPEQGL